MHVLPAHTRTLSRVLIAGLFIRILGLGVSADVVTDWNATLESALRNPTPSPAVQVRASAIVHGAIFDAVNGIARKYAPLRVTDPAPPGARAEAAAAQAAYTTLLSLFPTKQALFDTQLAASLAQIPGSEGNSQSIASGRAWGETVAQQILAWRANDGFSQVLTYTGSSAAGYWRHAPLAAAPAGGLSMTVTTPFALTNPAAFEPGPPYGNADRAAAMATAAYAADVNEVKAKGGTVSTVRTAAQAILAQFINVADGVDINTYVRQALPANARLVDNARTFALLNIAANDATIVCFQSKYKYGLWRPLQAIPFADEDGNVATAPDSAWVPLGATPSHPEFLSGHAIVSSAMLAVAAAILGDDTTFTLTTTNPGAPAITPVFTSFSAYSDAIVEARINIGFHFRTACTLGQSIGYAVAGQIVRSALLPQAGSGLVNLALRGRAGTGADTLVAGFVVGAGSRQVLIRGVGPALAGYGVTAALADPRIVIYDGAGRTVAENDNWSSGGAAASAALTTASGRAGAFPLAANSLDAALLTTLSPGAYSVHVSSTTSASGIALIEAYEVP
ncbi:vanadium-dependent haloperoxidase [Horticoccus sp. 23ND18S-11]|uniref:vanadium-dependent haloperoxidase n=1 Tax=Horticoccus sp. 23ND18S-11 TaxID=3391832 RepID=UPI0039C9E804